MMRVKILVIPCTRWSVVQLLEWVFIFMNLWFNPHFRLISYVFSCVLVWIISIVKTQIFDNVFELLYLYIVELIYLQFQNNNLGERYMFSTVVVNYVKGWYKFKMRWTHIPTSFLNMERLIFSSKLVLSVLLLFP